MAAEDKVLFERLSEPGGIASRPLYMVALTRMEWSIVLASIMVGKDSNADGDSWLWILRDELDALCAEIARQSGAPYEPGDRAQPEDPDAGD